MADYGFLGNILVIVVALVFLNWTSNIVINYATKVAALGKLGKTSVGFTLISLATTLPELTVALSAALSGGAPLSIGNALGSNIFNITVILGLGAILLGLKLNFGKNQNKTSASSCNIIPSFVQSEFSNIEFGLFVSSLVPLVLIYTSTQAAWLVGLLLLVIFAGYMYRLSKVKVTTEETDIEVEPQERGSLKKYILFTVLGALGVVISANFLVESAIFIATSMGVSQQVIGATIIAAGTSLPELTISIKSILRGHPNLALGNIVGASFFNTTLILGIALFVPALVGAPLTFNMNVFLNLIIFAMVANVFFSHFLSRRQLTWKEGTVFLIIYALFLIATLGLI